MAAAILSSVVYTRRDGQSATFIELPGGAPGGISVQHDSVSRPTRAVKDHPLRSAAIAHESDTVSRQPVGDFVCGVGGPDDAPPLKRYPSPPMNLHFVPQS